MEMKTTTKFRFRIEPKPGGGFIARPEEGSTETLEGATREEVQQKIDDKFTALIGEMIHNDKLTAMVGDLLQEPKKLGGVNFNVNFTSKLSTKVPSQPAIPVPGSPGLLGSSEPQFESSNKLWVLVVLLVAIGAMFLYFLKR